jgi:hypothetical protein
VLRSCEEKFVLLCHQHINSFILHYYGAEVGRNTDNKKSKQVFMTSLHSRKMPGIFAGCEKNSKSRRSKLQAKSNHLGDVTWKNPPLTLVKCGGLPMGRVFFWCFFNIHGLIVNKSPFWTCRTRFRRPATECSAWCGPL